MAVALLLAVPLLVRSRNELDLMALDDDTPRVLGIWLVRTRLLLLGTAALLTATAVSAIGVIAFVGLVAPHAARLVGSRHARVLPVSALLGALLVCLADTLGRTVIAPAQLPAGLLTALIGDAVLRVAAVAFAHRGGIPLSSRAAVLKKFHAPSIRAGGRGELVA